MRWLRINNTVYDDYIVENTFSVNAVPEYSGTDYLDGWWKKHRTVARERVMGTVTLAMPPAAYNALVANLKNNASAEGSHAVKVYVINNGVAQEIEAYVGIEGKVAMANKAYNHKAVFFNAILTIEER